MKKVGCTRLSKLSRFGGPVILVILVSIIATFSSCRDSGLQSAAQNKTVTNTFSAPTKGDRKEETSQNTELIVVEFGGVTLKSSVRAVSDIAASDEPATWLIEETDKPDRVWPSHLAFRYQGTYADEHAHSFFQPEVLIFPVAGFPAVLGKSKSYVSQFEAELSLLRKIIKEKPSSLSRVPRIPFYDGSPQMILHVRPVAFNDGAGVSYVTQFNIEPSIINNAGLTFIFQGLTTDGNYYVLATFPLKLSYLPDDFRAQRFRSYLLPEFFYNPTTKRQNEIAYRRYVSSIAKEIAGTGPDEFSPSLRVLEDVVSSLKIGGLDLKRQ